MTTSLFATGAGAATVDGAVGIRTAGGTYAGLAESNGGVMSSVTRAVGPGKTGKFFLEVTNSGSTTTAFRLYFFAFATWGGDGGGRLLLGKSDITATAETFPGFQLPALAPGTTLKLTMELSAAGSASPGDFAAGQVYLQSLDGLTQYSGTVGLLQISDSKGTTDHDVFAKTGGQAEVGPGSAVSSKTLKVGQKATFTLTMKNDSTTAAPLTMTIAPTSCGQFTQSAKVGQNDISGQVFGSGYTTGPLAKGKSVKVIVTVTAVAPWPAMCANNTDTLAVTVASPTDSNGVTLFTNGL